MKSDTEEKWGKIYWPFRKSGKTFTQAIGCFAGKYHYRPPPTLGGMPKDPADMKRRIDSVAWSECYPMKFAKKAEPKPVQSDQEKLLF